MSDEYSIASASPLKLKSDSKVSKKKKKKRDVLESSISQTISEATSTSQTAPSVPSSSNSGKTKAEIAYENEMRKREMDTMLKRATKTYKQRVMEFNETLSSMTEFYDIQKVSWTK